MYPSYFTQHSIDFGRTVSGLNPPEGVKMFCPPAGNLSLIILGGAQKDRRMHSCMERTIKGVKYRVYSSYEGDASFRELYEKCLASRLLKLYREGCDGAQPAAD